MDLDVGYDADADEVTAVGILVAFCADASVYLSAEKTKLERLSGGTSGPFSNNLSSFARVESYYKIFGGAIGPDACQYNDRAKEPISHSGFDYAGIAFVPSPLPGTAPGLEGGTILRRLPFRAFDWFVN